MVRGKILSLVAAACAACHTYDSSGALGAGAQDAAEEARADASEDTDTLGDSLAPGDEDAPGEEKPIGMTSDATDSRATDVSAEATLDATVDAGCLSNGADGSPVVEVAHWTFDDGAGPTASDSSGHCFVGTLQGGAGWGPGRIGLSSLDLQAASTAFVDVPGAVLNTTQPYTATAWAFFRRVDIFQTILGIDGDSEQAFQLQINATRFSITARPADSSTATSIHVLGVVTPQANVWYHLAVVFDGANLKLYVNGALQNSLPYTPWLATRRTAVGRGKHGSSLLDFVEGDVDDVHFYQGVLSDQDIAAQANHP
jgi:hypothetical protein